MPVYGLNHSVGIVMGMKVLGRKGARPEKGQFHRVRTAIREKGLSGEEVYD